MKEVWIPGRQEAQGYEEKQTTSHAIFEKTSKIFQTARQKSVLTFAGLVAVASVGLAGCGNIEFQSPIAFETPTSTPAPTPTPEPTLTPTIVPTRTPEPTPTKIPPPTATRIPIPTPTRIPTATPRPTETPRPTPTKTPEPTPTLTPTPTPTPEPTPTPVPTPTPKPTPTPTLAPTPTPTQVPKIELKPGEKREFSKCFNNTSTEPKKRSIDFESTGGVKGNMKAETRLITDLEKIIPQGEVFNIPTGALCLLIKIAIRSGASPDCYEKVIYNLRSGEPGNDGNLLEQGLLLQNFCIGGTLGGSFDERYFEYDATTNIVTSIIVFDNPANIPQQTKYQIIEPCSFREVAEQEIRDVATGLRIFPDQPQTIPAKEKVTHRVYSTLPYGKKPTFFPLNCTIKLDRILEE